MSSMNSRLKPQRGRRHDHTVKENCIPEESGNSREVSWVVSTLEGSCDLNVFKGMNAFSVFAARKRAVRMRCLGWVVKGVL